MGMGLGMGTASSMMSQFTSSSTLPSSFQTTRRGGIGSSTSSDQPQQPQQRSSFLQAEKPSFRPSVQIDKTGQAAFAKHAGSIGARMMEKMGYTAVSHAPYLFVVY
jgi:hypothetical protein